MRTGGAKAVFLELACENRPAVALFGDLGFEVSHRLPDYYGPGIDGFRMRLDHRTSTGVAASRQTGDNGPAIVYGSKVLTIATKPARTATNGDHPKSRVRCRVS